MILKGEKTILRPIRVNSDAPRYARWLSDPKVHQFLALRMKLTVEKEKKFLRRLLKNKDKHTFAIDTKEGVHIGSVSLELTAIDKRAEFGIVIGDKKYWGNGYGTDAMRTILRYGFGKLKLHKIELAVMEYNPRAIALYEKLGFKREGVRKEHTLWRGKFYDSLIMGILNKEWRNAQNKHRTENQKHI